MGGCPMNLGTHRSQTAKQNSTRGWHRRLRSIWHDCDFPRGKYGTVPRPPDVRVGLQPRMTLALIKSDSNEILLGAETDVCAQIDTMSEWDSNRGWPWCSSSRTATKFHWGLKQTAALHLTRCPSGTPTKDDLSRTAKYLQLNSVIAGGGTRNQ